MHEAQRKVAKFHKALGIPVDCGCASGGGMPHADRRALRASLIEEEARETVEALRSNRLVDTIDGLCDLLVVVYGTALEMGIDLEPHFNEVHASNMAKRGGPVREDGKMLKPEGWLPPDINGILQTGRGRYT